MKQKLFTLLLLFSAVIPISAADDTVITESATDVTQTRATLSAIFAEESTQNGFQFKYGELPELNDFDRVALDPSSEPFTFDTKSCYYGWKARANKGWVESYYDTNAQRFDSYFYTTLNLQQPGAIVEFEWQVSSEENAGSLEFWVNGSRVASITGETEFQTYRHTINLTGDIQILWQYKRTRAENSGYGMGYIRNIKFKDCLSGLWITLPADDSQAHLSGLYPGQGYVWRAFSVKPDAPTDTIFSSITQFKTDSIKVSNPVITPTQSRAKVSYAAAVGDAQVETGIVLNPIELTPFQTAVLASDSDPLTFQNSTQWYYSLYSSPTYVGYNRGGYDYPLKATFTLTEETDITFKWSVGGYHSTVTTNKIARAFFYIDGVEQKKIEVAPSGTVTKGEESFHLSAGEHTVSWRGTSASGYSLDVRLWDVKINNVDFNRPKTIPATIENDSVNYYVTGLKPGTDYRYYTFMRPTFESQLDKKWDIADTPIQSFSTLPISVEPLLAIDNTQTSFTARGVMDVGDANIVARGIQYRINSGTVWSTPKNVSVVDDTLFVNVKNLRPSTSYAFRAFVQAEGCDTVFSKAIIANTKAVKPLQPVLVSRTQHTVTIRGEIDAGEADIYTSGIQFRKFGEEEWEDLEGDEDQTVFTLTKTGLDMNTGYQARTYVQPYGSGIVYSDILYLWTKNIEVFIDSIKPSYRSVTAYGRVSPGDDNVAKASYWCYLDKDNERTGDITLQDTTFVFTIDNLGPGMKFELSVQAENDKGVQSGNTTTCFTLSYFSRCTYNNISPTAVQVFAVLNEAAERAKSYSINFSGEDYVKSVPVEVRRGESDDSSIYYYISETFEGLRPARNYRFTMSVELEDTTFIETGLWLKTQSVNVGLASYNITQTTAQFNYVFGIQEVTNTRYSLTGNESDAVPYTNEINLTGLIPDTRYNLYIFYEVNGGSYIYTAPTFRTLGVEISFADDEYYNKYQSEARQTSVLVGLNPYYGTATLEEMGVIVNNDRRVVFDSLRCYVNELLPGQQYRLQPYIVTKEGGLVQSYQTCYITTKSIELTTLKPTNISNRSATLNGIIDCDDLSSAEFGFQWKEKTGWTTEPRFTKGRKLSGSDSISVALVNGMLKPDTEYEYRTAVRYKDSIYYAEQWYELRTELEYVFYPATCYTLFRTDSENNCLVLCGYYIAGSESIISQGYEYWLNNSGSNVRHRTSDKNVILTDSTMVGRLELSSLADGIYSIRAFTTTESGTTYGQTLSFKVGNISTGIEDTDTPDVMIYADHRNIVVKNAHGQHLIIVDLNGRQFYNGKPQQEEVIPVMKGIYIVRLSNGTARKLQVR